SHPSALSLHDALPIWTCPQCGREHVGKPRVVREDHAAAAIPIEELRFNADQRQRYLDEQLRLASARGRKPGWAAWRYKEKFGERSEEHTSELQSRGHL